MTSEARIRDAIAELARTRAPEPLLPSVLREVGLGYWYATLASVLGPVFVAHGPRGVAAIRREAEGADAFERWFAATHDAPVRREPVLPARIVASLEGRWRGERRVLPLDLEHVTPFQRAVLEQAARIPRGEVRTYGWIAKEIGHAHAARAVGNALAHNPVPLVVPCHRVVPGDLALGAYSCGGPEAKRAVLTAEGVDLVRLEALAAGGVRFVGSDTTHVFCTPTCRTTRRLTRQHEVHFRSERAARQAGYRPCLVCRPIAEVAA
ncbi:MAG: methylated-DNA--[protein]-cysteine S-methyltransferase [Candidatus Dormiibacterota bacterium]